MAFPDGGEEGPEVCDASAISVDDGMLLVASNSSSGSSTQSQSDDESPSPLLLLPPLLVPIPVPLPVFVGCHQSFNVPGKVPADADAHFTSTTRTDSIIDGIRSHL